MLGHVLVRAVDLLDLRRSLPFIPALTVRSVDIVLEVAAPDLPFGPVPSAVRSVERVRDSQGSSTRVVAAPHAGLRLLVGAVAGPLRMDRAVRWGIGAVSGEWASGDAGVDTVGVLSGHKHDVDGPDLRIVSEVEDPADEQCPTVSVVSRRDAVRSSDLSPVDDGVVNPGLLDPGSDPDPVTVRLHPRTGVFCEVLSQSGRLLAEDPDRLGIGLRSLVELGRHPSATVDASPQVRPWEVATTVAHLACVGVAAIPQDWGPQAESLLGSELLDTLRAAAPLARSDDPLLREAASVRVRRCALSQHGLTERRRGLLARTLGVPRPSVSVLLMSRRAQNIPFALAQIARQAWSSDLEVVLALHGVSADDALVQAGMSLVGDRPVRVLEVSADTVFGTGLDRAVSACEGDLIAKWDDDDWYGPHHLTDLALALDYSGADAAGARQRFIHNERSRTTDVRRVRSERFVEQVGGGSFAFRGEVLRSLGVRPLRRLVDLTLARRLLQSGGSFYATHGLGYCVRRHDVEHTWHPPASTVAGTAVEARLDGLVLPPEIPAEWEELRRHELTSLAFTSN